MSNSFLKYSKDFIDLIFPRLCFNCQTALSTTEQIICISCKANLPTIDHHTNIENFRDKFLDIDPAHIFCFLQFRKDNISQRLLHEFKYGGFQNIGYTLGIWFGEQIKKAVGSEKFDFIIPVPLHQKKLTKRGFNQSAVISKGIASVLNIPINLTVVKRMVENKTQTLKSRSDRMFSAQGLFKASDPEKLLKNKHVLVVDDVITTGSTLAECAKEILITNPSSISIASLTMAK